MGLNTLKLAQLNETLRNMTICIFTYKLLRRFN